MHHAVVYTGFALGGIVGKVAVYFPLPSSGCRWGSITFDAGTAERANILRKTNWDSRAITSEGSDEKESGDRFLTFITTAKCGDEIAKRVDKTEHIDNFILQAAGVILEEIEKSVPDLMVRRERECLHIDIPIC